MILRFVCIIDITLASLFFHSNQLYSALLLASLRAYCVVSVSTENFCSSGVFGCTQFGCAYFYKHGRESVNAAVDATAAAAAAVVAVAANADLTFAVLSLILVHVIAALSVKKHFVRIRYNNTINKNAFTLW